MLNSVQNNQNLNFKGSFLVKFTNAVPEIAEKFENHIGQGKFFKFENALNKKGYTLYVLKHSNDLPATNFLYKNKDSITGLKYFPEVTKCEISSPYMRVNEYFKDKMPTCIESISKIKKFIDKEFASTINLIKNTEKNANKKKNSEYINTIAKKFNIDVISKEHNPKTRSLRLIGTQGSEMLLSPATENGNRYIFVRPKTGHGDTRHLLITCDGKILKSFETPDDYKKFLAEFKKVVEISNELKNK